MNKLPPPPPPGTPMDSAAWQTWFKQLQELVNFLKDQLP